MLVMSPSTAVIGLDDPPVVGGEVVGVEVMTNLESKSLKNTGVKWIQALILSPQCIPHLILRVNEVSKLAIELFPIVLMGK